MTSPNIYVGVNPLEVLDGSKAPSPTFRELLRKKSEVELELMAELPALDLSDPDRFLDEVATRAEHMTRGHLAMIIELRIGELEDGLPKYGPLWGQSGQELKHKIEDLQATLNWLLEEGRLGGTAGDSVKDVLDDAVEGSESTVLLRRAAERIDQAESETIKSCSELALLTMVDPLMSKLEGRSLSRRQVNDLLGKLRAFAREGLRGFGAQGRELSLSEQRRFNGRPSVLLADLTDHVVMETAARDLVRVEAAIAQRSERYENARASMHEQWRDEFTRFTTDNNNIDERVLFENVLVRRAANEVSDPDTLFGVPYEELAESEDGRTFLTGVVSMNLQHDGRAEFLAPPGTRVDQSVPGIGVNL